MGMVCTKTPDSPHDFEKDPREFGLDGENLHANKTTLGADDGIGIAIALAILNSDDLVHPPLEAVFTVDEELGKLSVEEISYRSEHFGFGFFPHFSY